MGGDMNGLSAAMLIAGAFFVLTGAVGVLRFPDFHSRIHPASKGDSLGQLLILGGLGLHLAIQPGLQLAALKLLLIIIFLFLTAPTATHAMARSAWGAGVKPEDVPLEPDEITREEAP